MTHTHGSDFARVTLGAEVKERLAPHPGPIASFSRALLEGLSVDQSDEDCNATLDVAVRTIYEASVA